MAQHAGSKPLRIGTRTRQGGESRVLRLTLLSPTLIDAILGPEPGRLGPYATTQVDFDRM
jgi:hypothetical protein